ncbi:MAG: LysR family transcriptional regulator [Oscillospiraceae bacterium]|nr:LysR family transcriptional regulator [Oscillospiraceae bacterium]
MIETYQLQQLVAFAACGTLSEAAVQLHISQPTLTRTMKKLEEEFGVPLFSRTKNKMELNENGELALKHARKLLEQTDDMVRLVRALDRAGRTISIGSCAPMPLNTLVQSCSGLYPGMTVSAEMKDTEALRQGLEDGNYQFIILPEKPDDDAYYAVEFGHENLYFALPVSHPCANRESLSFHEMNGENMIVLSAIGFWHEMIKREMPASRFLMQSEAYDFSELIRTSSLPYFSTDIAQISAPLPAGRRLIPISDACAHVTYYLICKKKDRSKFKNLLLSRMSS